ncbi:MAG: antifreeze protein [Pseudodonghicola sp.]
MLPAIDCANEMTRLWWRVAVLLEDAQCVVAMRIMGFSGVWSVPPGESRDMIREKMPAFTEGLVAGALTAWEGRGPDRVMLAVVGPISQQARANRSRLARRGLRLPAAMTFANDDDVQSQNGATAP